MPGESAPASPATVTPCSSLRSREAQHPLGWNRWRLYLRERFPLLKHGLLIAAFSSSAVSFAALLRGPGMIPSWHACAVAFVTCFFFFLQLRIADEFKDRDEDARFRPYRPVPRGLVKLRELAVLFLLGVVLQAVLALLLEPRLFWLLVIAWIYLALMSVEFFARDWLKGRPITYLWTHMLIMPIVDFYATACHWLPAGGGIPSGLKWFLAASFFNGVVLEFGRKIRHPAEEEEGVPTYSKLWGRKRAAAAWGVMLLLSAICGVLAAHRVGFMMPFLGIVALALVPAAVQIRKFCRADKPAPAVRFEAISGIWTLLFYLGLGLIPLAIMAGLFH